MTGFNIDNERPDIALAYDKAQSQSRENASFGKFDAARDEAIYQSQQYATSTQSATPITQIIRKMIQDNNARSLWFKNQIFWDVEDIFDAVIDVCISLGIDEEQFTPEINDRGEQVEIYI
jgi:hypothetical protein